MNEHVKYFITVHRMCEDSSYSWECMINVAYIAAFEDGKILVNGLWHYVEETMDQIESLILDATK